MFAARAGHEEMVTILLNAYASLWQTAFSLALKFGATKAAKILLAHPQVNPDPCSRYHRELGTRRESPLIIAIQMQKVEIVRILLDKGVNAKIVSAVHRRGDRQPGDLTNAARQRSRQGSSLSHQ